MASRSAKVTAALIAVTAGASAFVAAPLLADNGGRPQGQPGDRQHQPDPRVMPGPPMTALPTGAAPTNGGQAQGIGIGAPQQPPNPGDGPMAGPQDPPRGQENWGRNRGRQFRVTCEYVKSGMFDPIVFPGQDMVGHTHQFFGNTEIAPDSTAAKLVAGNVNGDATSCYRDADGSAYWVPSLQQDGIEVIPDESTVQYRAPRGTRRVRPFPAGLTMIAGDKNATTLQPQAGFRCEGDGRGRALTATVPTCAGDEDIVGIVTFPACWDGTNLSSSDQSHMAYATRGAKCPADHPVPVPELRMETYWPSAGAGHVYTLSSGDTAGLHADFMNGWDQTALRREVRRWFNRGQR